ncbi:MAG TPA: YceH family protein [Niabella sp.]|nr:YceH family protein [Niabella sp.]HQW15110.1 YceH family protein [Niabella sp.]HQX20251.1 YceH family protein [Niabella sp.]HQX41598.1 YceH family protein [Niabella sp.]HRB07372.1 YceH family protein [Niabella sp.]
MSTDQKEGTPLPILDSEEIRVLGALMEKSRATPEYYPMTLNGLTAACNQKTSRNPVVNYEEQTVGLILDRLKRKNMVATVTGGSSRVVKYRHTIALHYQFTPDEIAVLCLLFLRGPLTPGEINSSSGRLYEFDDLSEVQQVLEKLSSDAQPFLKLLPRQPGQKEARYLHLFADETMLETYLNESTSHSNSNTTSNLEERLRIVEEELAALKTSFEKLMKEWIG